MIELRRWFKTDVISQFKKKNSGLVFYVDDLFINRCSIYTYYISYRTDVESPRLSISFVFT